MAQNIELPNLLIVGAAKCGTTSLHHYLRQDPDIFMTEHKEPHFLINSEIGETRIHRAVTCLNKYKKMFQTKEVCRYKGESSVMYLAFPEFSIKNIRKHLSSDVKIIIMLRNPVERAFAGYLHNLRYNPSEDLSFQEAIAKSEERYHQNKDMSPDTRYLHVGNYASQVELFVNEFKSNVHIIIYDDYVDNIDLCLLQIFDFLDIKQISIDTSEKHMVGGWVFRNKFLRNFLIPENQVKSFFKKLIPNQKIRSMLKKKVINISSVNTPSLTKETRNHLIDFYRFDVERLSKLLNRNFNHWLE